MRSLRSVDAAGAETAAHDGGDARPVEDDRRPAAQRAAATIRYGASTS